MEPPENDPPEKSVEEVVKCWNQCSYLLARTMFLKGTPMSESAQFASSIRPNLNSSTILQTMCSGFPKLHEMLKNQKKPACTKFQRLLHTEMGIADLLPRLQMEVRNLIEDEVALRSGLNSYFINTVVSRDLKEREFLEQEVLILDAIHQSENKGGDILAIWSGNEELVVSIEVSEEWNQLMKKGLDSYEADQEQIILCNSKAEQHELNRLKVSLLPCFIKNMKVKEVKDVKSRIKQLEKQLLKAAGKKAAEAKSPPGESVKKAPEAKTPPDKPVKNLLNWVLDNQSVPSLFWRFFNNDLGEAVQFGSQASILLKKFLDNLPEGQQSAMKIEQLQVSLQMFAEDEGNVAAKKILKLKLSGFSSTHQNVTGACEADDGTVHLFKKLFIALDMIFRHPICLKKGVKGQGRYRVKKSRDIYVKQCHGLLKELAEKLKLELKMPQEYCDSEEKELRDIIKSWSELSPKCDSFFGTSSSHGANSAPNAIRSLEHHQVTSGSSDSD